MQPSPQHRKESSLESGVVAAMCAIAVAFEAFLVTSMFADAQPHRAEAVFGVLKGTPHWRAYQNRLLGPHLVRGIQLVTSTTDVTSLLTFFWLAVAAKAAVVYTLFKRITGRSWMAGGYVVLGSALSSCCLSFWVYPWDYLDAIFISLMLMGIARRWSLRAWIAVFAFGLWNRETALLVPLWLLIDGALVAGASLAAAGGAFVFWIRATLFRHRLDVTVDPLDTSHSGLSNHLMLWRNAREFWTELPSLGRGPTGRARLITASVIAGCVIALMLATRLTSDGKKALVWSLAALATVVTFGAIGEARIWIGFIPIILFWIAVFAGHARSLRFLRSLG